MVASYKGAVTESTGVNGTTLTLDPTIGFVGEPIEVGDFMLLTILINNHSANAPTTPDGWNFLTSGSSAWVLVGSLRIATYWKYREVGDTTHSVSIAGAARNLQGSLVWFGGVEVGSTPIIGVGKTRSTAPTETTTTTALSIDVPDSNRLALALAYERTSASIANPEVTGWSSGWTMEHYIHQGSTGDSYSTFAIAAKEMLEPGSTGNAVATYASSQATNGTAVQLALQSSAEPGPTLLSTINGYARPTEAAFNIQASDAELVEGEFSTSSDFTTGITKVTATSKGDGYYVAVATGLEPDTTYYWRAVLDGSAATTWTGSTKTLPLPGNNMRVVFGSCFDSVASATFGLMKNREPDYILQLGDLGYNAPPRVDQATLDTLEEAYATRAPIIEDSNVRTLLNTTPWEYTYSDRDGAGGNSDGTYVGFQTGHVQTAYRRQIAHPDLPMSANGARSWVWGRVRFIMTDETTLATGKEETDNSSKTKLGTEQKAWFKSQIDLARDEKQLVIWSGDSTWFGSANTVNENPWSRYSTERAELGSYISNAIDAGMLGLIRLQGDTHALFLDDGTNNPDGGFIVAGAAPWHTTANPMNYPVTDGAYPTSEQGQIVSARQYGLCDIEDVDDTISVTISGYSSSNSAPSEVLRYNKTFEFREEIAASTIGINLGVTQVKDILISSTPIDALYLGSYELWRRG